MAFRIQLRRDTSDKWVINNPILLEGEFGYEIDTTKMKIGDGVTPWNDLPYWYGAFQSEIGTYFNGVGVTAGATGLNFTGSGVSSVTDSNGLTTITITGGTGGGSAINTYFSGAEIGTGITGLNFTGSAVSSVTDSSGYTTITITGGTGSGSSGTSGISGSSGTSGISGSSGTSGVNGSSGSSGADGSSGSSGVNGSSGSSGSSGESGSSGSSSSFRPARPDQRS